MIRRLRSVAGAGASPSHPGPQPPSWGWDGHFTHQPVTSPIRFGGFSDRFPRKRGKPTAAPGAEEVQRRSEDDDVALGLLALGFAGQAGCGDGVVHDLALEGVHRGERNLAA
jgi:hypothetical protein